MTLTLKIFDGLCVRKDIVEGGKSLDKKSMLALGKTLKIGEEVFEDLDKVSYINSDALRGLNWSGIQLCFACYDE